MKYKCMPCLLTVQFPKLFNERDGWFDVALFSVCCVVTAECNVRQTIQNLFRVYWMYLHHIYLLCMYVCMNVNLHSFLFTKLLEQLPCMTVRRRWKNWQQQRQDLKWRSF